MSEPIDKDNASTGKKPEGDQPGSSGKKKQITEYRKIKSDHIPDEPIDLNADQSIEMPYMVVFDQDLDDVVADYKEEREKDPLSIRTLMKCLESMAVASAINYEDMLEKHPELDELMAKNSLLLEAINKLCLADFLAMCAYMIEDRLVNLEKRANGEEYKLPEEDFYDIVPGNFGEDSDGDESTPDENNDPDGGEDDMGEGGEDPEEEI